MISENNLLWQALRFHPLAAITSTVVRGRQPEKIKQSRDTQKELED